MLSYQQKERGEDAETKQKNRTKQNLNGFRFQMLHRIAVKHFGTELVTICGWWCWLETETETEIALVIQLENAITLYWFALIFVSGNK